MKITYTYESVTYNGQRGWFAVRRVDGVFAGRAFGKTKKAAREAIAKATGEQA